MFKPVDNNVSFPKLEEEVLEFWKQEDIYRKSLAARDGAEPFVFYEGPPTANGMPHPGHCLTRAIKDVFPRYKTMRGYRCERKAGWDTHGLPVEVEVCKELGIHSKEEIEEYGIEPFIQKCQAVRLAVHAGVGTADRAAWLLGQSRRGLRHLPPKLRRKRVVEPQSNCSTAACCTKATKSSGGGPKAARHCQRRSGARLPRGGRSECVCEVSAAG